MFDKLPPPANFEQGQRKLFGLAMMGAGIVAGAVALGLVILVAVLSFKFPGNRELILYILAGALGSYLVMQSIVMISMAVGGPVGRFKVQASKEGFNLSADGDGETPEVTATATVTMTPGPDPQGTVL